ncbi:MAG TPA: hypothetical protein VH597_15255 [Verrucomicrobiae bacterium]|nr:hypothetical protein [Verrucomicrobiae bacterium]
MTSTFFESSSVFFQRHERRIVFFILGLFLVFNLVTAPFSPDPWNDEISYSEPAVTLAATGHLTSHAWGAQGQPVWTGNSPLHQLLLAGFIKIFGFGSRTVRGIDVIYYTLAVLIIYQIVRGFSLIETTRNRLLLILVLLSGTGLVALYRNGRYDTLGALLVILWVWFSLLSKKRLAFLIGVFFTAILMPIGSLNIAPLLVLCGAVALFLWRWQAVRPLAVAGAGCLTGMAIMQVTYAHFGVPHVFHALLASSGGRDVGSDFVLSVFKNPSYIAAVAVGCLLIFPLKRDAIQNDRFDKKIALALFSIAVIIPIFMAVVAKYHIYYSWMAIIPGTICAFMAMESKSVPNFVRVLAVGLILVATLPGFPRRCIRIASSWMQNRPAEIASAARKDVSSDDVVFVNEGSVMVYYGVLPAVRESFWLTAPVDDQSKAAINVVFWPEAGAEKQIHDLLGSEWRQTDYQQFVHESLSVFREPPAHFAVYRRI